MCIIPSITTAAAFGEFTFPLASPVYLALPLNFDFLVAGCGIADVFRNPTAPSFQKALGDWTASSFSLSILQVLVYPINLLETILT